MCIVYVTCSHFSFYMLCYSRTTGNLNNQSWNGHLLKWQESHFENLGYTLVVKYESQPVKDPSSELVSNPQPQEACGRASTVCACGSNEVFVYLCAAHI